MMEQLGLADLPLQELLALATLGGVSDKAQEYGRAVHVDGRNGKLDGKLLARLEAAETSRRRSRRMALPVPK